MMIYFAYPFVLGFALAYLWQLVEKSFMGGIYNKAYQFAKLTFIVATIPGMFLGWDGLGMR